MFDKLSIRNLLGASLNPGAIAFDEAPAAPLLGSELNIGTPTTTH